MLPGATAKTVTNPGLPARRDPPLRAWHTRCCTRCSPSPASPWKPRAQCVHVRDHALLPGFYTGPGALGLEKEVIKHSAVPKQKQQLEDGRLALTPHLHSLFMQTRESPGIPVGAALAHASTVSASVVTSGAAGLVSGSLWFFPTRRDPPILGLEGKLGRSDVT